MIAMKRSTVGLVTALLVLFAVGTVYAQQHAGGTIAKTGDVVEVFCDHMGTGQLCAGSNATAKLFNLSGTKKDRYVEAINTYNKAVAAAQKQFLEDAKAKVGLEPAQLAVAETWFTVGLNPEINKIIAIEKK
jgi:hypothetical protein